jgi:hypothetical protein
MALAYTSYPGTLPKSPNAAGLRQIQICPWLINYAMASQFGATALIGNDLWDKWRQWGIPKIANSLYTPIDMVSLFDKIILHEVRILQPKTWEPFLKRPR